MSTALAVYLVAAGLQIRFQISNEEALKRAVDLWKLVLERV